RIDWEESDAISKISEDLIIENIEKNIDNIDAIILSDYDKGVLTKRVAEEIIKIAREHGKIVTVDPKPKNVMNYVGATSITPNRKEAIECLGKPEIKDVHEIGKALKEKLHLTNLLLTRSEEGMSLFGENGVTDIPTFAKEVYDVTGAGDTVISVFTLAAASGVDYNEAAKIANVAAGVVVGRVGTSTVTKEEILEFYERIYSESN
ncbi:MAG: bifunctional heptose 7-phosphate kinase/heptose 1-phosphate adenyltransferase, partial [Fusobacteriaceae bacterium]